MAYIETTDFEASGHSLSSVLDTLDSVTGVWIANNQDKFIMEIRHEVETDGTFYKIKRIIKHQR